MDAELPEETVEALRGFVERGVRAGFEASADIVEAAIDTFSDDGFAEEQLRPYAIRFTVRSLAQAQEEAQSWPAVTDCDRLDAAFTDLEAMGVIARQNFSCCQSCGHGEAWEEVVAARSSGRAVHGYAFYHQQDTESAVDGHGLLLAYGATESGRENAAHVGREVADALQAQGLAVSWDGSVEKRIHVQLDWRRRRT